MAAVDVSIGLSDDRQVERPFSALSDLLLRDAPAKKAPADPVSPGPNVELPKTVSPAKVDEESKKETVNSASL